MILLNCLTNLDNLGNLLLTPIAYFEMYSLYSLKSLLFKSCSIKPNSSLNSSKNMFKPSLSNVKFLDNMYVILFASYSSAFNVLVLLEFKFNDNDWRMLVNILKFWFYMSINWSWYVLNNLVVSLFCTDLNKCLGIISFFKIEDVSLFSLYFIALRILVILFNLSSRFIVEFWLLLTLFVLRLLWLPLPVVGLVEDVSLFVVSFIVSLFA